MTSHSALIFKDCLKCRQDLIIAAKSCEYKVHRIVFLCLSPYFQKLFHYRSKSKDGYYRMDMKDVSDYIVVSIINFAYSGQIVITENNIEELVITADKYNIISIMDRCQNFLRQRLSADNCIEIYLLTHYYNCPEINTMAHKFILDNNILAQENGDSCDEELTTETVLNKWLKKE